MHVLPPAPTLFAPLAAGFGFSCRLLSAADRGRAGIRGETKTAETHAQTSALVCCLERVRTNTQTCVRARAHVRMRPDICVRAASTDPIAQHCARTDIGASIRSQVCTHAPAPSIPARAMSPLRVLSLAHSAPGSSASHPRIDTPARIGACSCLDERRMKREYSTFKLLPKTICPAFEYFPNIERENKFP